MIAAGWASFHKGEPRRPRGRSGADQGVARHFDLDPTIVRIGIVALSLMGGAGVPLYVAGWLLIPDEASDTSIADDLLDHVGLR